MAILHWKQAKDIEGTYHQTGYTNEQDLRVPITVEPRDRTRSQQDLRNALYGFLVTRRTTGIYGTSYTVKEVNLNDGYVVVTSSTYIGD